MKRLTQPKRRDKRQALAAAFVQQAMSCGVASEVLQQLMEANGADHALSCGCLFSKSWGYMACKAHKSYSAPRTCFCTKVAEMVPKTSTAFRTGAVDTALDLTTEKCTGVIE